MNAFAQHLPEPLLRSGPLAILWWQWLALPLVILGAWILALLLTRVTHAALARLVARKFARWDAASLASLSAPLKLGWVLLAVYLALPWLDLSAHPSLHRTLRTGFFVAIFWGLARLVDVAGRGVALSPWAQEHPASRSLISLGSRVGKVAVWAIALVALLAELGYPVASLVAGLGIGGLAVALAAQKTVENLFGAFSLGADQPFREGDFVRVEDFVGTVEAIGLRSTQFRTLDRTLISIPNGKLADMRLESFAARDRLRLACDIGLVYSTSAAQMREVLAGFERVLRAHAKIWPDTVVVKLKELADSALVIEVMAWFQTSDWSEFQTVRQEMLLQFMDVVERAGTSFAFPTRTVHVVNDSI